MERFHYKVRNAKPEYTPLIMGIMETLDEVSGFRGVLVPKTGDLDMSFECESAEVADRVMRAIKKYHMPDAVIDRVNASI